MSASVCLWECVPLNVWIKYFENIFVFHFSQYFCCYIFLSLKYPPSIHKRALMLNGCKENFETKMKRRGEWSLWFECYFLSSSSSADVNNTTRLFDFIIPFDYTFMFKLSSIRSCMQIKHFVPLRRIFTIILNSLTVHWNDN